MQGAGKSFLASDYEDRGYLRLNQEGSRLVSRLEQVLEDRQKLVVLDGRFPTRRSRAPIIATARAHGIPTRCVYLRIAVTEAQVNIARRMLEQHGRLLEPEELKAGRKTSSPASLVRWLSTLEMPSTDEGFSSVEATPFVRRLDMAHRQRGLLLGVDGVLHTSKNGSIYPHDPDDVEILPGRFEALVRWIAHGYHLFFVSNQNPCSGGQAREMTDAILRRTAELLKLPVTEIVHCPHQAHPIVCWCCKPMPGLGVYLIDKHKLARRHLVVVGNMNSDVEFAAGLGARFIHAEHFFRMSSAVAGLSR
jgi:HAD superfamily hydrolase (TIGR01662 family)